MRLALWMSTLVVYALSLITSAIATVPELPIEFVGAYHVLRGSRAPQTLGTERTSDAERRDPTRLESIRKCHSPG